MANFLIFTLVIFYFTYSVSQTLPCLFAGGHVRAKMRRGLFCSPILVLWNHWSRSTWGILVLALREHLLDARACACKQLLVGGEVWYFFWSVLLRETVAARLGRSDLVNFLLRLPVCWNLDLPVPGPGRFWQNVLVSSRLRPCRVCHFRQKLDSSLQFGYSVPSISLLQ